MSVNGYGQVYRTMCPHGYPRGDAIYPYAMAFRGTIYLTDDYGKNNPVWEGMPCGTPSEAFVQMERAAKHFGVEDLRLWSGKLPDEPLFKEEEF